MTNSTNPITWNTTDLPMSFLRSRLGDKHIASLVDGEPNDVAAVYADSRANGAWMANDREMHAMYRSLATHLRAGTAVSL